MLAVGAGRDGPDLVLVVHRVGDGGKPELVFDGKELALLNYARKLTADVAGMDKGDIDALRHAGCDDGEILEVNQVCAYFNYSNRLLNGLGVTTEGDVIGFYSEDSEDSGEAGEGAKK